MAAGEWVPAYDAIREALALAPSVRAITAAAALEHLLGRHHEAHTRLEAALAELPGAVEEDAVVLMIELGRDGFYQRDYGAMLEWARRALEVARELGDRGLMATAAGALTMAASFAGVIAEALAAADEGAALVDAMPDAELARHLDFGVNGLAGAEILLDRLAVGAARAERGLLVARATGQGQVLPVLFWTGTIRSDCGRLREAAEILDEAIEIARVGGQAQGMAWNLFARSFAATAAGDTALALATARESVAALRGVEPSFPATGAHHSLAAALFADGDADGAREALLEAGGDEALALIPAAWRPRALELHTRILLALDRREAAAAAASAAQELAERLGLRSAGAYADRAARGGERRPGCWRCASAAAFAEVGAPVQAALSRALAGAPSPRRRAGARRGRARAGGGRVRALRRARPARRVRARAAPARPPHDLPAHEGGG